jgi:hypothetical protein
MRLRGDVRRTLAVAALALCLPVFAAVPKSLQLPGDPEPASDSEVAWPAKKTVVYIPFPTAFVQMTGPIGEPAATILVGRPLGAPDLDSTMRAQQGALPVERLLCENTKFCWYFVPACEPLSVATVRRGKETIIFTDRYSYRGALAGANWLLRLTHSEEECRAAAGAAIPPLRYREFALQIVSAEEAKAPMSIRVWGQDKLFEVPGLVQVDSAIPAHQPAPSAPAASETGPAPPHE